MIETIVFVIKNVPLICRIVQKIWFHNVVRFDKVHVLITVYIYSK